MDLEDQLRGDAAGASSARLIERIQTQTPAPGGNPFATRYEVAGGDPHGELKTRVQRAVIAKLGPRLFGATHATGDLRTQVTEAVTAEIDKEHLETPLAQSDRERLVRELTADILGYGPIEPYLAEDDVTEVMVNGYNRIYVERFGRDRGDGCLVRRRRALAADHRQDRLAGRSPCGRVVADGGRAAARRQPCQRDHPAAVAARPDAHDPQVLARSVHDRRPDRFRVVDRAVGRVPPCLRPGQAERAHLGRYRHGEDDDAERALGFHPGGGADRDDRGCGRAAAAAGALGAPRVAARRTSKGKARSRSASSSATRCACGPTGSWSARFVARRRSTCSRR